MKTTTLFLLVFVLVISTACTTGAGVYEHLGQQHIGKLHEINTTPNVTENKTLDHGVYEHLQVNLNNSSSQTLDALHNGDLHIENESITNETTN